MKIALFDQVRKFTHDLVEHWIKQGHEVKIDRSLDPRLVHWADTTFFEFCEGSAQRASHADDEFWIEHGAQPQDKNIIVRLHDIDIWVGGASGVNWDWINHAVFVSDYMKDVCGLHEKPNLQIHTFKHGIDLNKWTFGEREHGKKMAWIGNINQPKCLELGLQVLAENPDYELHVVGDGLRTWESHYIDQFVKRNNLKYFYYGKVPSIDEFLEDKNYLLLTSFKEAFSFVSAEAMAKGIKPLIHNFSGAETVWDKKYLWNKISEVRPMLEGEYNSQEYRDYVDRNFNFKEFLDNYDKIIYKSN